VAATERGADMAHEFDLLYARAATGIQRQMLLLTGDAAEAEDVTQEAFERAWLHWSTVRCTDSPEAWVRTAARRVAVSRWRRMRNSSAAWLRRESGRATPPAVNAVDAEGVALITALKALPLAQRTAIVLFHFADLPVARVAEETGSSVAAVKQQLVRGRASMAQLLASESPDKPAGEAPGRPEGMTLPKGSRHE